MTTRQEILLRLACAALQGGMPIRDVCRSVEGIGKDNIYTLWDIANVIPDVEFGADDADTPPEEDTKLTINKKKFY